MLHILLPPKELFTAANAGATAGVVAASLSMSKYRDSALVFGSHLDAPPLDGITYQALRNWRKFIHGRNKGLAQSYIAHLRRMTTPPRLIEVHGRPRMAAMIAAAFPEIPVALFLHNDARDIDGSRTTGERQHLMGILGGVFSNSAYTQKCFLEGIDTNNSACVIRTCLLGSLRHGKTPPRKDRLIVFAGRMVPEKGGLEAAQAMARILPRYPDWRGAVIGARTFRDRGRSRHEEAIAQTLRPLVKSGQVEITGHLPRDSLRAYQQRAAIILAPSRWQEPAGLVVTEALAAGAALITSNRGGITEYASGRAIMLDNPSGRAIADTLAELLDNPGKLKTLQHKAWRDYPFTIKAMCKNIDAARDVVMQK